MKTPRLNMKYRVRQMLLMIFHASVHFQCDVLCRYLCTVFSPIFFYQQEEIRLFGIFFFYSIQNRFVEDLVSYDKTLDVRIVRITFDGISQWSYINTFDETMFKMLYGC